MVKLADLMSGARETVSANRVFGEPCEVNGMTVLPVAAVRGGAGGGEGEGEGEGDGAPMSGTGGGFGLSARPVGAFVVKDDEVTWLPAADTTRVIVIAEVLAIVALLVLRSILRRSCD